jgi:hypothetical protein
MSVHASEQFNVAPRIRELQRRWFNPMSANSFISRAVATLQRAPKNASDRTGLRQRSDSVPSACRQVTVHGFFSCAGEVKFAMS